MSPHLVAQVAEDARTTPRPAPAPADGETVAAGSVELAEIVDAGRELRAGGVMAREIRACAVHACELIARRLDILPRTLDNWLWDRAQHASYSDRQARLTRIVFYRGGR